MTCIGTILSLQQHNNGKTTRMICDAIRSAIENPDKHILLCVPHIENLPELPPNITVLKTNSIDIINTRVNGGRFAVVEIDHYIKDIALVDQHKIIEKQSTIIKELEDDLVRCRQKLDAIEIILKS